MKYWNKMMVTFQDDTQVICDKIIFEKFVPFSEHPSPYVVDIKMPSFRLVVDGKIDDKVFTKRDIKEVSPIHGVPLLITIVYNDHVYEFLKNDFSRQEQWSQQGFESFHEAYTYNPCNYRIQYFWNQIDYNSLIHNEVAISQENFRFMNDCPKMIRRDEAFINDEHFPNFFLDAVYEEGIALYGKAGQEKCYLYSIEPLYFRCPETKKGMPTWQSSYDNRNHYHSLSGIIDLSKKTVDLQSNTEEWDHYSSRYDEITFYKDYLSYSEKFSTRHLCSQFFERLKEKCSTNKDIDVKSNCQMFHIEISLSSLSPIDWGSLLSIRFTHHPSSW